VPVEPVVSESLSELIARLVEARQATDELFALLRPEALRERPIPERHRLIFYLGHLEAFDWNLLAAPLGLTPHRPDLDRLFAFGIDPTDGALPDEPASAWPAEDEVRDYDRAIRDALDARLGRVTLADERLLHVAIEHRWMHAETLAYQLHQLDPCFKAAPPGTDAAPPSAAPLEARRRIPAGRATLGRARDDGFGWDNEYDEHAVEVPEFEIDATMIRNARWLEFIADGGYGDRRLWSDADWTFKEREKLRYPKFWIARDGDFAWRGMFGERELAADWPVYVSHAEAAAYARWAGRSLPSEAQLHRAAYGTPGGEERPYPWGDAPPSGEHGNFDFRRFEPAPTGAYPAGRSAFGVDDLLGNGWEWTRSLFEPFSGFEPFAFYPGYSADFFDGKHYVIKGGSARTAACLLRRSFRNWFQPHYGNVYAGFRTVSP